MSLPFKLEVIDLFGSGGGCWVGDGGGGTSPRCRFTLATSYTYKGVCVRPSVHLQTHTLCVCVRVCVRKGERDIMHDVSKEPKFLDGSITLYKYQTGA